MTRIALVLLALSSTLSPAPTGAASAPSPRLVLQITVDQLRGDLIERYAARMDRGGFRYLLDNGVVFADARHTHANTETVVGHATLATGATPSIHGLIGNVWFDRALERLVYNIEDPRYPLLTAGADVDKGSEIDPSQKTAKTEGRSPAALLVSTFGDELAISTAGKAKIFGVSVKDRGAVAMAGHAGKAFWFSKKKGEFVSSRFYYERYPEWVAAFNDTRPAQRYAGKNWELLHEPATYLFGARDDQPWETSFGSYGRVFPHPYGPGDGKYFTTLLTLSPAGDELTLDFSKALLENEALGTDSVTDYLSISFSSTDYVGHVFGPSSLEAEDSLLRLDRMLADLFTFVEQKVGLENTLIVLSADHGGPEVPGSLNELGIDAGYVNPDAWDKEAGIANLKQRFGIGGELIAKYFHPYVYLNRGVIRDRGLNQAEVEQAVAEEIMKLEGVAMAVSSSALMEGRTPDTALIRSILDNHNPGRSGDVFVVFEPHRFINDFDGLTVAATHGSPWTYDTFVPLIFAGANLQPGRVYREVQTLDVATTLSAIVGTKFPSGASGQILVEALGRPQGTSAPNQR